MFGVITPPRLEQIAAVDEVMIVWYNELWGLSYGHLCKLRRDPGLPE